jgi:hypothetical protein
MRQLERCCPPTHIAASLTSVPEGSQPTLKTPRLAQSAQQTVLALALFIDRLNAVTAWVHTSHAPSLQA